LVLGGGGEWETERAQSTLHLRTGPIKKSKRPRGKSLTLVSRCKRRRAKQHTKPHATTLLGRFKFLAQAALANRTKESYGTAVDQYKAFMAARNKDSIRPTATDICLWITETSLFIKTDSILKYLAGVRYYLDGHGTGQCARDVMVARVVRGLFKTYGTSSTDDREPITMYIMIAVLKSVDITDHDERCYAAAAVIGFLNCLRIGEFTSSTGADNNYLRKADWKQDGERGCIRLRRCKTDIFGRGHDLKYRKMSTLLNPIFWMGNYAQKHINRKWADDSALFLLKDGSILSRRQMINWFRAKATPWCQNPKKLNGISFRRGGAQVLREQGFSMEELGVLGRWLTMRVAARYIKLTDPIVDRFADAFDTAATKAGGI
jgi:hypothetical protein